MSNPLTPLARVVAAALDDKGISVNGASIQSGIPRETLRRRLVTGDFKHGELWRIAEVLDTTPASLVAQAEKRAA
jgi:lambda repressor-like predicted transcriptional regulator